MSLFDKFKKDLLTKRIKTERDKPCFIYSLESLFSEIYIPSLKSFFLVFLFTLVFFILAHLGQILEWLCLNKFSFLDWLCSNKFSFLDWQLLSYQSNHYQNLIAIHAGIGTIIFALVIFIAESMRDDEVKDKARVLLKESYLFPIAVAEILSFFVFIWGDVNFWSIVPVFAIGILTIVSLSRIIAVLLNKYRFAQKRAELFKERLQQSIDLAIDERIGNNILLSKLNDKDIKLEFHIFSLDNEIEYHCFNTEKFGIVSDLDLKVLRKIANIIDDKARGNGFSFGEEKKPEVNVSEEGETQEYESKTLTKNNQRYLMKKFHDVVNEESRALICIHKELLKDNRKLEELNSLVRDAFIIKQANNFTEEIRYEISGLKDQFVMAIANKQLGKIEELVALYRKVAEGFLEHITKCGGGYSAEQARQERHSISGGWKQIRWLSSDIRTIVEKAMQSHDKEIINAVAYLPVAIAGQAIEKNDHYLFQEFIRFAELIYSSAIKEIDKDLKNFLTDRSWRYLKDISGGYVEAKLRKGFLEQEKLESLKNFGIHFFIIFQNLLKLAFDNKDFGSFEAFKKATQKLFDYFSPSKSGQNSEHIKWYMENVDFTSDEQKSELKTRLEKQSNLEKIEEEINTRRNQMYFGLASWILDQFLSNKTDGKVSQFYDSIQAVFPSKIEDFTDIFLKAHSFDVEDFWGWSWWEMRFIGEVHNIQIFEKLERFYAVKSISLLAGKTDEEIKKIELPFNRDLADLAGGSRNLIKILDDIKANPDNWKSVLSDNAINKVGLFKDLLFKTKNAQEQKDLQRKRELNISQMKVEEFKDGVVKGFKEYVVLRDIFRHCKLLDERLNEPIKDNKYRFGIDIAEDKAAFFEDWHVHFIDWGNNYGHGLASGENSSLFDEVAKNCKKISKEEFDATLSKFESVDNVIIVATDLLLFGDSPNFKPKWHNDAKQLEVKGFGGWYKIKDQSIPAFETYHRKIEKQILILNKKKLGQLIQLSPLNDGENKGLMKDIFYMNVQAFSENKDLMDQFINKPPQWLQKIGDEQKQREHLQERVLIHIFERFKFSKPKDFEGYKLLLKED